MWQRWNQSTHIFEKSIDNGGSWSPLGLNAAIITEGSIGKSILPSSVAYKDEANIFTATPQQIGPVANARLVLNDSSQPVDSRVFRIMNSAQLLHLDTVNDAQTIVQSQPLRLSRTGDAYVGRDIYEKGRINPLGHWIQVPFLAANFSAAGGGTWTVGSAAVLNNRYTVIGKTLHWQIYISWFSGSNAIAGAVTGLLITVPGGFQVAGPAMNAVAFGVDGGVIATTPWRAGANGATVEFAKNSAAAFAVGAGPGLITTTTWELL